MEVNFDHNPRFKLHFYSKSFIKLLVLLIQPTASADVMLQRFATLQQHLQESSFNPSIKNVLDGFSRLITFIQSTRLQRTAFPEVHCAMAVYLCLSTRIRINELITQYFA